MKFRKKPVEIEAHVYDGTNAEFLREWTNGAADYEHRTTGGLCIKTLEGPIWARVGDWIIRGVQGEFYPCKPDIFAETYEPAWEGAADEPGEPNAVPTPEQLLRRMADADPAERLAFAERAIVNSEKAHACFLANHRGRIGDLERQVAILRAEANTSTDDAEELPR